MNLSLSISLSLSLSARRFSKSYYKSYLYNFRSMTHSYVLGLIADSMLTKQTRILI